MTTIINHLNKRKVGLINVYTVFNNRSYNGYNKKVLLSGICKYFRRGMFDKFLWCVIEMALFKYHTKGICLVTNVLNRMRILIMEELLFSENIGVIIDAINIIENIDHRNMKIEEVIRRLYSFCKIVKTCNRSRAVSYYKEWFRYEGEAGFEKSFEIPDIDKTNMVFNRIKKFEKSCDTPQLLQLGEILLKILNSDDDLYEKSRIIMRLYWEFSKIKETCGRRYRRNKAIYLFWEIIDGHMKNKTDNIVQKWTVIFKFGLNQYFREQLTERHAFGVWMILYCVYSDNIDWTHKSREDSELLCNMNEVIEYIKIREASEVHINEDFVIKDWHVNRNYDIGLFARVGAYIKDEKHGVIDVKFYETMKVYYIKKKNIIGEVQKERKRSKSKRKGDETKKQANKIINKVKNKKIDLEFINWNEFSNVKILHDGVCGGKVCCIVCEYKGKKYVLKEMKKSLNFGVDAVFIDRLKSKFGLLSMHSRRIRSNKGLVKINPKGFYRNNCFIGERANGVVYVMMNYFENVGNVVQNKDIRVSLKKELLKIRLFDGLFRSSDNIQRNILVGKNKDTLMSIDEGDIYGKRHIIFNRKGDWDKKNFEINIFNDILNEWNLIDKIPMIEEKMIRYGFKSKIKEMKNRLFNYREIVLGEIREDIVS